MSGRMSRGPSPVRSNAYALTFDAGARSFQLRLPRLVWVVVFILLPLIGSIYLGATIYWIFHDDLLASLMRRSVDMQYAYEDRIGTLRHEIDSLSLRARSEEARFTTDLQKLTRRQAEAEGRTALLLTLSERMKTYRLSEPKTREDVAAAAEKAKSPGELNPLLNGAFAPPLPEAARAYAPLVRQPAAPANGKPHPEVLDLRLRGHDESVSEIVPSAQPDDAQPSALASVLMPTQTLPDAAARLNTTYDRLEAEHMRALVNLLIPARRVGEDIRTALATAGLAADDFAPARTKSATKAVNTKTDTGMGGPFIPLPAAEADAAFAREALVLQTALDKSDGLRRLLPHIPLHRPLDGVTEVTSNFGARIDPFLGRAALHTGLDLRGDYGAAVLATAAGVVTFAGPNAGYGNMVEVDHGNGLTTRYAHLSAVHVAEDQKVEAGTIVGRIGTTGRSTGPHLHYETRIAGEPVDPERFLRAGALLFDPAGAVE
jgi:murein DD-endopeptidase MepM/ murein hydrolase activator NlpD